MTYQPAHHQPWPPPNLRPVGHIRPTSRRMILQLSHMCCSQPRLGCTFPASNKRPGVHTALSAQMAFAIDSALSYNFHGTHGSLHQRHPCGVPPCLCGSVFRHDAVLIIPPIWFRLAVEGAALPPNHLLLFSIFAASSSDESYFYTFFRHSVTFTDDP